SGHHYASYITRITFDPNKSWPEMIFRPLQKLTDDEFPVIIGLRQNVLTDRITGGGQPKALTALPNGRVATGLASLPAPSVGAAVPQTVNGSGTTTTPS